MDPAFPSDVPRDAMRVLPIDQEPGQVLLRVHREHVHHGESQFRVETGKIVPGPGGDHRDAQSIGVDRTRVRNGTRRVGGLRRGRALPRKVRVGPGLPGSGRDHFRSSPIREGTVRPRATQPVGAGREGREEGGTEGMTSMAYPCALY